MTEKTGDSGPERDDAAQATDDAGSESEKQLDLDQIVAKAIEEHSEADEAEAADTQDGSQAEDSDTQEGDDGEDQAEEAEEETEDDAEDAGDDEADDEDGGEAAQQALSAPEHWPVERREAFGKLPREAQDILLSQEKDMQAGLTRKTQELSEQSRFAETIHREFEPFQQQLALSGLDEPGAVRYLLAMHRKFTEDPRGYLEMVAKSANIDLGTLGKPPNGEGDDDFADLALTQLRQELGEVKTGLSQFQQAQLATQQSQLEAEVTAFASEQDKEGNPLRPHFERLQGEISQYVGLIRKDHPTKPHREVLQEAYDRAVWGNEDIRKDLLAAHSQGAAQKVTESQQEAVKKAKKVKTIKPSGGQSATVKTDMELDDAVTEAMRQHGAL